MNNKKNGMSTTDKLPKGLKLTCVRHGITLRYHNGDYYCLDKFDGGYCALVSVSNKIKQPKVNPVK